MRWELHAGPEDGEFGTFLTVQTEGRLVGRGGHLGLALPPGAVTSISVHRWWPAQAWRAVSTTSWGAFGRT
jgi:hypothetical protein